MLSNYTAYARLLVDGHPSHPFSLRTLPADPAALDLHRGEVVRRTARRRFASAPRNSLDF